VALPISDGLYYADVGVPVRALVEDDVDAAGDLIVRWLVDGEALAEAVPGADGTASDTLSLLPAGSYSVVTEAEDSEGNVGSVSTSITVGAANSDPECAITTPVAGGLVAAGASNLFEGTASDAEDEASELTFELLMAGSRVGSGSVEADGTWSSEVIGLNLGSRTIDLVVSDSVGGECSTGVQVTVSNAPAVSIQFPTNNGTVNEGAGESFLGTAIDQEDSEPALEVVWTSDIDGTLGTGNPTTIGEVVLDDVVLSAGTHVITLEATDSDGLTGRAAVNVGINGAPTAPEVSITPVDPGSESTLSVSIDVESTDPEEDDISYEWSWYRGGALEDFFDNGSVPSTQTNRAETWSVEVVAVDARGAVSPLATATTTIANALPTVDTPTISPAVVYADTELTCTEGATADGDGDTVTVDYEWYIEGSFFSTGATLAPLSAVRGQDIVCVVTPFDTVSYGAPSTSATSTVINAPPEAPTVVITPAQAESFNDLTCAVSVDSYDADVDFVTYTYEWLVGGVSSGITGTTVASAQTVDGEQWMCEVTPDDGFGAGVVGSAVASIGVVPMMLDVGTQSTVYTGNTRGYWFEAPVNLTITGLRVPITVTGDQNIEVMRFNSGAPPAYPGTTSDYTSLYYISGEAGGALLPTTIVVAQGDFIGILGARGSGGSVQNSYRGGGAYATDFGGNAVTLTRLLFQGSIATGQAGAVSAEPTSSIARVEVEYTVP